MTTQPLPPEVGEALECLFGLTNCKCHEAFTSRDMQDPECQCLYREDVDTLHKAFAALTAERDALAQRLAAVEKDAERYLWLRDKANELEGSGPLAFSTGRDGKPTGEGWQAILCGEQLDAAIDAAMKERP